MRSLQLLIIIIIYYKFSVDPEKIKVAGKLQKKLFRFTREYSFKLVFPDLSDLTMHTIAIYS